MYTHAEFELLHADVAVPAGGDNTVFKAKKSVVSKKAFKYILGSLIARSNYTM